MFEQSIAIVTLWCLAKGQLIVNPMNTAAAKLIPGRHTIVYIYESCGKAQLTTPGMSTGGINSEWDDPFFHQHPLCFHPWLTAGTASPVSWVLYVPPCNSQTMFHGCLAKSNVVCAAVSLVLVLIYEE